MINWYRFVFEHFCQDRRFNRVNLCVSLRWRCKRELKNFIVYLLLAFGYFCCNHSYSPHFDLYSLPKFRWDKLVLLKLISFVAPNCYIPLPSIVGFLLAILCVQFQTAALWPRALKIFDNLSLQLLRSYACWAGFVSTNRRTILGWCPNFSMTGHTCCDMLIALILKLEKMWYQTLLEFHLQSSF